MLWRGNYYLFFFYHIPASSTVDPATALAHLHSPLQWLFFSPFIIKDPLWFCVIGQVLPVNWDHVPAASSVDPTSALAHVPSPLQGLLLSYITSDSLILLLCYRASITGTCSLRSRPSCIDSWPPYTALAHVASTLKGLFLSYITSDPLMLFLCYRESITCLLRSRPSCIDSWPPYSPGSCTFYTQRFISVIYC
jgi:hypothetical protein